MCPNSILDASQCTCAFNLTLKSTRSFNSGFLLLLVTFKYWLLIGHNLFIMYNVYRCTCLNYLLACPTRFLCFNSWYLDFLEILRREKSFLNLQMSLENISRVVDFRKKKFQFNKSWDLKNFIFVRIYFLFLFRNKNPSQSFYPLSCYIFSYN